MRVIDSYLFTSFISLEYISFEFIIIVLFQL